ncbi:5'-nucleotidase, lipoprotein e(P4) family [Pedobacter sp. SYP-B3415]|uniref:5'-nucleotidase, lipoprotein e(P4) family n=1 Tax=Pedobacter sp. SYP-B3415 TaxID=2496641 RepID=UPI00101BB952|nr:5'-nucleotidase, lipoprotein e(P4) family [Pedobacter sp. SYP-B3415]
MAHKPFWLSCLLLILSVNLVHAQNRQSAAGDYTTAVLWQQHSGEYRALCFQAYNFARVSLKQALKKRDRSKPNCIVVDIDETVLDNSAFQGHEIRKGISFAQADWTEWGNLARADTVPGALSFLKFAARKKIEIFYITNREQPEYAGTLKNLQRFGFPNADPAHLLVKGGTSDKEPRRQDVAGRYNILLLCGDNLSDFSNIFYRENRNTREEVDHARELFGKRFIVVPNPMYGDWEKPLYPAGSLSEEERSDKRFENLKSY